VSGHTTTFPYSAAELDRFRQVQRLAYDIALKVEAQLQTGMTEAEVCTLIAAAQADHDVIQVFHEPFAWFGRRTMLGPDWAPDVMSAMDLAATGVQPSTAFFPTEKTLAEGMPLIIDLAPVVYGTASDIGYSCRLGRNEVFDELDRGLAHIRTFLAEGIRAGETLLNLYRALDALIDEHGWQNCHQHYPDRALGHLVFPLGHDPDHASPMPGFGPAAADGLLAAGLAALENGTCYPVWNDSSFTDYPAAPGLWAVEPHIGLDGVGVKFEELLVVTGDDAYWLDDHLPHCLRWAAAGYSHESARRA
jgi:Xaa-Pro aminopeptidase